MRGTPTRWIVRALNSSRHTSAVDDFHRIEEDPDVDQLYIGEMTALLQRSPAQRW